MHRPDLPHHIPPLSDQGGDLVGLAGQLLGNVYEQGDFAIHDAKRVIMRHLASIDHSPIAAQCLTGQDNPLVGFGGGHGGSISVGDATW